MPPSVKNKYNMFLITNYAESFLKFLASVVCRLSLSFTRVTNPFKKHWANRRETEEVLQRNREKNESKIREKMFTRRLQQVK